MWQYYNIKMSDIEQGGVTNYLNTLIFCIVAKAITICMLALLLFDWGKRLAYLILTIEVGLIAIVIYALWSISQYEKKVRKAREDMLKGDANITTCPDYFTKNVITNVDGTTSTVCESMYAAPDNRTTYNFDIQNINMTNELSRKTLQEACTYVGDKKKNFQKVAWTDLKSRCYDINGDI